MGAGGRFKEGDSNGRLLTTWREVDLMRRILDVMPTFIVLFPSHILNMILLGFFF